MKSAKSVHRAHPGRTLERAARELAECEHPEDQRQTARLRRDGSYIDFIRCSDCGAVAYENDGYKRWTRPMLVAHVTGASS
jgi:hypothetical protein